MKKIFDKLQFGLEKKLVTNVVVVDVIEYIVKVIEKGEKCVL